LAAFGAAFGTVSLLCDWLRTFVLGWYEAKWSPAFSLGIDTIAALFLFIPVAMLGFAIGAYSVNTDRDPWVRSLLCGVALAVVFFAVTRLTLHIESVVLMNALVWGTLFLGGGIVGAWARSSERRPAA
jgi:hypothetical protein